MIALIGPQNFIIFSINNVALVLKLKNGLLFYNFSAHLISYDCYKFYKFNEFDKVKLPI